MTGVQTCALPIWWNKADVLLFEYFNKSFWKKIEQEGGNFYKELTIFRQKKWEIKRTCVTNGTRLQTIYKGKQAKGYVIRNDLPSEQLPVCQKLITSEIDYLEHLRVKQRQPSSHFEVNQPTIETEHKREDNESWELAQDLAYEPVKLVWTSPETRMRSHAFFMVKFQDERCRVLICPYFLWRELTHVKFGCCVHVWQTAQTRFILGQLLPVFIDLAAVDCKTVVSGRFRKAGSAVSVILECEAREPFPSPFLHSLLQTFRSNMVRRSRSQKIRLFCSL